MHAATIRPALVHVQFNRFLFESRRFSARWECEERAARCFGLSSMVLSFSRQISASRGRERDWITYRFTSSAKAMSSSSLAWQDQ